MHAAERVDTVGTWSPREEAEGGGREERGSNMGRRSSLYIRKAGIVQGPVWSLRSFLPTTLIIIVHTKPVHDTIGDNAHENTDKNTYSGNW